MGERVGLRGSCSETLKNRSVRALACGAAASTAPKANGKGCRAIAGLENAACAGGQLRPVKHEVRNYPLSCTLVAGSLAASAVCRLSRPPLRSQLCRGCASSSRCSFLLSCRLSRPPLRSQLCGGCASRSGMSSRHRTPCRARRRTAGRTVGAPLKRRCQKPQGRA